MCDFVVVAFVDIICVYSDVMELFHLYVQDARVDWMFNIRNDLHQFAPKQTVTQRQVHH